MNLYKIEDLENINIKYKKSRIILLILCALYILTITLFVIFSKYENRIVLEIISSIILSILSIVILSLLTITTLPLKRVIKHYSYIINSEGSKYYLEDIKIKEKYTSLTNGIFVYDVCALADGAKRVFYINRDFIGQLQSKNNINVKVVNNFIKEIEE